ncbi:hypothetical protein ACSQ6I_09570 [Anabaena sp. WFMT]|uniref:hypothetical protein n=1 Tax=Anabaena sp. WFMT TaxID=3449730 RepID=UPI003F202CF1
MANIHISKLLPTGYELFNDSASFLNELATQETLVVSGGGHSCHGKYHGHNHSYKDYSYKDHSYKNHSGYSNGWW